MTVEWKSANKLLKTVQFIATIIISVQFTETKYSFVDENV